MTYLIKMKSRDHESEMSAGKCDKNYDNTSILFYLILMNMIDISLYTINAEIISSNTDACDIHVDIFISLRISLSL